MKQGFYMIYVADCGNPTYRHYTYEEAEIEAKRLSSFLKRKAYILETIVTVESCDFKIEKLSPIKQNEINFKDDELPF